MVGVNPGEYLEALVQEVVLLRYGFLPELVRERLRLELFQIREGRQAEGILERLSQREGLGEKGPLVMGVGSDHGSLVLHLLGMTAFNPMHVHGFCRTCQVEEVYYEAKTALEVSPGLCDHCGGGLEVDGFYIPTNSLWNHWEGPKAALFLKEDPKGRRMVPLGPKDLGTLARGLDRINQGNLAPGGGYTSLMARYIETYGPVSLRRLVDLSTAEESAYEEGYKPKTYLFRAGGNPEEYLYSREDALEVLVQARCGTLTPWISDHIRKGEGGNILKAMHRNVPDWLVEFSKHILFLAPRGTGFLEVLWTLMRLGQEEG